MRSNNSVALTIDGRKIRVVQFLGDPINKKEFCIAQKISVKLVFHNFDLILKKVICVSNHCLYLPTNDIFKVCVCIETDYDCNIHPVPNLKYY